MQTNSLSDEQLLTAKIQILPSVLANQIAAGEVIERPASVVKELIENSLDAGARKVVVEIETGGQKRIAVSDDGEGMVPEDVRVCFERHATSKIRSETDLHSIHTFGFRGEALASITSVARVYMKSRHVGSECGLEVIFENSRRVSEAVCGMSVGTSIVVEDLFSVVPARKKFLKTVQTETACILDMVWRYALAYPEVFFTLISEKRKVFDLAADDGYLSRFDQLKKGKGTGEILTVSHSEEVDGCVVAVEGLIAKPTLHHRTSRNIYLYVNRRPVRDRLLLAAVSRGYEAMLERGRYPEAYLFLRLPAAEVDVNVHPTKQEVRFVHSNKIYDVTVTAIRKVLALPHLAGTESPMPAFSDHERGRQSAGAGERDREALRSSLSLFEISDRVSPTPGGARPTTLPVSRNEGAEQALKVIGQWARSFIVCQELSSKALVIIDQHALHEKVAFVRLKREISEQTQSSQQLLFPRHVDLSQKQMAAFGENRTFLAKLGFDCDVFGDDMVLVRGIPSIFAGQAFGEDEKRCGMVIREILDDLLELSDSSELSDIVDRKLMTIACHSVVRAHDDLSLDQMQALVDQLSTPFASHCPHGRPTFIEIPLQKIQREFERSV